MTSPFATPGSSAATSRCSDRRASWVLDTIACMDDDDGSFYQNATTATASTNTGITVEVSFALADPSGLSRCFVRCTGCTKACHRLSYARVIAAEGGLLLLRVSFISSGDYFVYRSSSGGPGKKPSLRLLPRPYPPALFSSRASNMVAIAPCGNGKQYVVVIPVLLLTPHDASYVLHVFSSATECSSTNVAQVDWDDEETNYTVAWRPTTPAR